MAVAFVLGGVVATGLIGRAPAGLPAASAEAVAPLAAASRMAVASAELAARAALAVAPRPYSKGPPRWVVGDGGARPWVPPPSRRLYGLNWQVDPYET
jgi:hypothetical protein